MSIANRDQAEHWNSGEDAGHWITHQARYDRMLGPFAAMMLDQAAISPGDRVLDVGCGCGATTLAAAALATAGEAVGIDLSMPMLARDPSRCTIGRTSERVVHRRRRPGAPFRAGQLRRGLDPAVRVDVLRRSRLQPSPTYETVKQTRRTARLCVLAADDGEPVAARARRGAGRARPAPRSRPRRCARHVRAR